MCHCAKCSDQQITEQASSSHADITGETPPTESQKDLKSVDKEDRKRESPMRTDAENEPKRVDISATPLPKEIPPVVSSNQVGLPVVTQTSAPTSAEGSKYS